MRQRPILLGFLVGGVVILVFFVLSLLVLSMVPDGASRPAPILTGGDGVGIIEIDSTILTSDSKLKQIKKFREDGGIRAILVRIDSPGGAVGPSQEIYAELMKTRRIKPVVASLGSTAASGGYYIASAANLIVSNPGTLTGSIGAVMEFLNLEELLKWAGVEFDVVKSGRLKDVGSFSRDMTPEERRLLQELVDDVLDQFVNDVAAGRQMPVEQVRAIADGRILTGAKAKGLGLVDRLGNLHDAIDAAAELAGISGEPRLVPAKERKLDFFDVFWDQMFSTMREHLADGLAGESLFEKAAPLRVR
ncbi:signal peptide peptidase SppA [bacterium]|nr:signal peptide peptidase SppA [bacterium]